MLVNDKVLYNGEVYYFRGYYNETNKIMLSKSVDGKVTIITDLAKIKKFMILSEEEENSLAIENTTEMCALIDQVWALHLSHRIENNET